MSKNPVPITAPAFLVHKAGTNGEAPVWTAIDGEEPPGEETYRGPERRSGAERRSGVITNWNFGNIERRVKHPFGRRKTDRAV